MKKSLDAIADGADLAGLNRHELAALLAACAAVQTRIAAALIELESSTPVAAPERLLSAKEAAERLGVAPSWVYRRAGKLSFAVKLGGQVRFSERKLDNFIANHAGVNTR